MGRGRSPVTQAREDAVDIDYLPRGRPVRRRALSDEFDRECGYSYDHDLVFVRFSYGDREYECANCGDRVLYKEFSCAPDIHEMLEVGALELAFQPPVYRSREILQAMARDRHMLARRRSRKNAEEEEDNHV